MYPDILRGDHGYPTISLTNAKGVVFSFARGNIKDFFNISTPNKRQDLRLPLAAFVFDIYLKDNPKPDGDFFDEPIIKITFDFLSHPDTDIDMEIGNLHGQQGPVRPRLDFETNLVLSKRPEHGDVPMMATAIAGAYLESKQGKRAHGAAGRDCRSKSRLDAAQASALLGGL